VWFKAKNNGAIDGGNIHLGDEGKQTAIRQTKVMVALFSWKSRTLRGFSRPPSE
jgi:hypothetical protein